MTTVGPNIEQTKVTSIGEAAHISGARIGGARYDSELSDSIRAEITNGIWLCRNCHRKIDQDDNRYPSSLLFVWREKHESFVTTNLGSKSDKIRGELEVVELTQFESYPSIVRRIAIDRPIGWEWRLTAELLRYLNEPLFRELRDIRDGLYNRTGDHIEGSQILPWTRERFSEMTALVPPFVKLLDRMTESWGAPKEEGNINSIHHSCCLIHEAIIQIVEFENRVAATLLPDAYIEVKKVVSGPLGEQALKLEAIPSLLENALEEAEEAEKSGAQGPLIIEKTIIFDLTNEWVERAERVMHFLREGNIPPPEGQTNLSEVYDVIKGVVVFIIVMYIIISWVF